MADAKQKRRPVMLVVLDGWGWREEAADNAVRQAKTPTFDRLWATGPRGFLRTSGRDVGLPDGTGDEEYLRTLETTVPRILTEFRPGLVFYLAGADAHERDRLGRLRLTHAGLRRRDEFVLQACRDAGIPVAITLGGGYGQDIQDTVEAHCNTVRAARAVFDGPPPASDM